MSAAMSGIEMDWRRAALFGVPWRVFVLWFGRGTETPPMSANRARCLRRLVAGLGAPMECVTWHNLHAWRVPGHPFHEALPYLSGNHKSDYLRAYLLHHHGGGYADIKAPAAGWWGQWERFADPGVWLVGRAEKRLQDVAWHPEDPRGRALVRAHYRQLVSMGWVIARPHTPYTAALLGIVEGVLDRHLAALRGHPAPEDRWCFPGTDPCGYPLRWCEVMGEVAHPLQAQFLPHLAYGLPDMAQEEYL